MRGQGSRWTFRVVLTGLFVVGMAASAGCGGGDEQTDPCEDTTCQFGVCDSAGGGSCTNPDACQIDADCLPGYACGEAGSCVADRTCSSDSDCSVCEDEVCVNPESCQDNDDCLARTYCADDGTCQPDPCNHTTCERGVCERGTGECVASDSCTKETQYRDCLAGQTCIDQTCQTEEDYCSTTTCERGVCSFEALGCVDADNCEGDDAQCTEGKRCNDMNNCAADLCEKNDVTCEGGGECDPATGKCENAETCTSTDDCTNSPTHWCVRGTCRLAESACGDAGGDGGCPGNQTCQYNDKGLQVSCVEPEQCETSIDCQDDRQCGGRNCGAPVTCRSDRFEDNESADAATDFLAKSRDHALRGSLCRGDTDVFEFATTEMVDSSATGKILVEIYLPRPDVGLGPLEASLEDSDGNEVAAGTLDPTDRETYLALSGELTEASHGDYTVELAAGTSMSLAGLNYEMSVNIVTQEVVDACGNAESLEVGTLVSGDTTGGPSTGLDSSCVAGDDAAGEAIYALELETPKKMTFEATPRFSDTDLALSIRGRCTEPVTERACEDGAGVDEKETLTTVLGRGTHYVVVQSPDAASGGAFTLETREVHEKLCTGADNYCTGSVTANWCVHDGGRFEEIACDMGCNPSTGGCYPVEGNYCSGAPTITGNASRGFDLRQTTDAYGVQPGGCLGESPRTGGPDNVYALEVPSQKGVTVTARYDLEVEGSMYLADSCDTVGETCAESAQDSTDQTDEEQLRYSNRTDSTQTRFLVVDSAANQNLSTVSVEFAYQDVICEPGTNRCGPTTGDQEVCDDHGMAWETSDACGAFPCADQICRRGNNCTDVPDVTRAASGQRGAQYTLLWGEYSNDFQADDTCGGSAGIDSGETAGHDAVFQVDGQTGDVLSSAVHGIGNYSLYLKESTGSPASCDSLAGDCLAADRREDGETAEIEHTFSSNETVYLVVDTEDGEAPEGATLDIDLQ